MQTTFARTPLAVAVVLCLAMTLPGCGGGGGGGNVRSDPPPSTPTAPTNPPTPPTPDPPTVNPPVTPPVTPPVDPPVTPPVIPPVTPPAPTGGLAMPKRLDAPPSIGNEHLRVMRATDAHLNGYRGSGQFIALFDTGAQRTPVLDQHLWWSNDAELVDPGENDLTQDDANGHGTATAMAAIGRAEGAWGGGIAPDANVSVWRIIPDTPTLGNPFGQPTVDAGLSALERGLAGKSATSRAAGFTWDGDFEWSDAAISQRLFDAFDGYVAWSAGSPSYDGLVVFAAGDRARAEPAMMARLPSLPGAPAALADHWITVAAVETARPDRLAAYSNGCGSAMDYCLVAPGDMVLVGKEDTPGNPTYWSMGSTQVASPLVLGAAALVWGNSPYLSAEVVHDILLGTTTDLGVPGPDPIFGQGLIDVTKAMRGPGRLDWGDVDVFLPTNTDMFWTNDISGAGGIRLSGAGWMLLHGDNTFQGPLRLEGNVEATLNGRLTADLQIERGATVYAWDVTLEGDVVNRGSLLFNTSNFPTTPTVFKGNVRNEGYMANWAEVPVTTMEGDLTLAPTSMYQVELGADPLRVTGHVIVDGELHLLGVASGYVPRSNTEVLIADGGLEGTFTVLKDFTGLMTQATLSYDANRVWLDLVPLRATQVSGMAFTPASFSAAQRLDEAFGVLDARQARKTGRSDADEPVRAFADAAGTLQRIADTGTLQRSLESLSGELHGMDAAFATMAIEGTRHAVESRVDALRDAPAGAWSDSLEAHRAPGRFDMDANGWMTGVDLRHDARFTVGAALSQMDGMAFHAHRGDREHNRQYDGQLYAAWDLDRGYVLGTASFGQMQRAIRRDVLLGDGAYRVGTDYAQRHLAAGMQAGMRSTWDLGTMTFYAGAQAIQLDRDAFEESGASGFGLRADASTTHASQALFGTRLRQQGGSGWNAWTMQARLEWQRQLGASSDVQAAFSALDAWAPVEASGLSRETGVFGLGFEKAFGRRARFGLDVDARHERGETWSGVMATWTFAD